MKIILDSNILFSALIKDSITRKLILEYEEFFLFPEFIFEELTKYKLVLVKKSKMNEEDFNKLMNLILTKVLIVPNELLLPFKEEALDIIKDIDLNDVIFIACGLAYRNSIIWSDDKKLKKQNRIKILNTKEMIEFVLS
tara:strand:+ start:158 stop:574 length:417 start_codon:yes stop_codon:yes gene_type:complete